MDCDSDSWETWTTSYGERCIENEQSLHHVLLQQKNDSINYKKRIVFGICVLGLIVGICGLVYFYS